MKKIAFALSSLAVLAVAGVANADPTPSTSTTPNVSTTTQAQPGVVTSTPPSTTLSPTPAQPVQQTSPNAPTSTTTVTSADATATPTPPATEPPTRETTTLKQTIHPNRPLLFTGGILFASTYATTAALTAANTDGGGDKNMYIPVVGPWLHLADSGNHEGTTDTLLVAGSGVLQGVGVGMAIASLFVPEKIPAATIQAGNVKMNMTAASFGRGSAGLGAVGEF